VFNFYASEMYNYVTNITYLPYSFHGYRLTQCCRNVTNKCPGCNETQPE